MFPAKHLERSVHTLPWHLPLVLQSPALILCWLLGHHTDNSRQGHQWSLLCVDCQFFWLSWTPLFLGLLNSCPCSLDAPSAGHRLLHCPAWRLCGVFAQRAASLLPGWLPPLLSLYCWPQYLWGVRNIQISSSLHLCECSTIHKPGGISTYFFFPSLHTLNSPVNFSYKTSQTQPPLSPLLQSVIFIHNYKQHTLSCLIYLSSFICVASSRSQDRMGARGSSFKTWSQIKCLFSA